MYYFVNKDNETAGTNKWKIHQDTMNITKHSSKHKFHKDKLTKRN